MRKGLRRLREILGSLPSQLLMALVVTVVATVVAPPLVAGLTTDRTYLWVLTIAVAVALLLGLFLGAVLGSTGEGEGLRSRIRELESRTGELGAYETYAVHLRDALADLRRVAEGALPSFSTRDFIETGIFAPAHDLLVRDHRGAARGEVRFSILHPQAEDFVMADESGLFPALGHRAESRQRFRMPIRGSFAGVAFDHGEVRWSNDLSAEPLFKPHPKAIPERRYESIVCVPLWRAGEVSGVLNVIATRKDAFTAVDRTYVTLLASVIDVAEILHPPLGKRY